MSLRTGFTQIVLAIILGAFGEWEWAALNIGIGLIAAINNQEGK